MVEEESIGTKIRPSMPGTWNEHPLSRDILKKIMIIRPTTTLIASLTMTMEPGFQMPIYSYTGLSKLRLGEDLGNVWGTNL